jgi:prepilin-type N-terminal cleavage/methylation domain-containing protein
MKIKNSGKKSSQNCSNLQTGFTLIELLIVIAIIGVLASTIILAINNARLRGRDAKRAGDVRQMVTAFEQYRIAHGVYPTGSSSVASLGTGVVLDDPLALNGVVEAFVPGYAPIIPTAPTPADGACGSTPGRGNNNYWYDVADNGTAYTLTFCLGKNAGQWDPGVHEATPNGVQ